MPDQGVGRPCSLRTFWGRIHPCFFPASNVSCQSVTFFFFLAFRGITSNTYEALYQFSIAAVTNDHKLSIPHNPDLLSYSSG